MTRRLRRNNDFEVVLQITRDDFIRPPREAQRNWLLNRALSEFVDDLQHLDQLSRRFVSRAGAAVPRGSHAGHPARRCRSWKTGRSP
jgi:hypothetical protein